MYCKCFIFYIYSGIEFSIVWCLVSINKGSGRRKWCCGGSGSGGSGSGGSWWSFGEELESNIYVYNVYINRICIY